MFLIFRQNFLGTHLDITRRMNRHSILLGLMVMVGCGAGSVDIGHDGTHGQLKVALPSTSDFPSVMAIREYRVTISADDMPEPLVATSPVETSTSVTIPNIPAGSSRHLVVAALNSAGQTVREGEALLDIVAGQTAKADIDLDVVPVVTNLINGAYRPKDRLWLDVLTDPDQTFGVEVLDATASIALADLATQTTTVKVDSQFGRRRFYLPPLSAGRHTLRISDPASGRSSLVELVVGSTPTEAVSLSSGGWKNDINQSATGQIGGAIDRLSGGR